MSSRNVLNAQEVDRFVDDLAKQTARPELERWLGGSARRWILKHYDLTDRILRDPATGGLALVRPDSVDDVVPRAYLGEAPDWCQAALERGDEVIALRLGAALRKRLRRVMAMLEAELEEGCHASLDRLPFEKAETRAHKHRRDGYTARRKARIARAAVPVFRTAGGADVVRLTAAESLRTRYQAVLPDGDRLLRLRRLRVFSPYGIALRLYQVALPLAFLNLVKFRVFRACEWEPEARILWRQVESDLTNLALAASDRLFALGPLPYSRVLRSRLWDCPADLLANAPVDVSGLRVERHAALRRRLNRAKRRELGRRARPAKGHLALRRLLDDPRRDYVL